jgi:hypothetical protein
MKNLIFAAVIILFSFTTSAEASTNIANRVGGYFYASLSPHGTWIDIGYGTVAWKPTIMLRTWKPYYQGRWIWSDYGWYWDSYEPFGHIVYHYGRWYYDDYYGWIWVPDYEWAPAWVEWRYTDTYIGWAPLSPYGVFSISIGIHFTHDYYVHYSNWHYVHVNHFYSPHLTSYYVGPKYKYRIHSKTKYRTNYGYYNGRVRNNGIDVGFIEKRSGQKIRQMNVRNYDDPRKVVYDKNRDISRDGIRTFYVDKKELSRENLRDVEVKRSDRRSSLDLSRVELSSTRDLDRDRIRKENAQDDNKNARRDNNIREDVRDRKVETERKTDVRENRSNERIDKRQTEILRNETPQIQKRNTEQIKRENNSRPEVRSNEVKIERKKSTPPKQETRTRDDNIRSVTGSRENNAKVEKRVTTPPKQEKRTIERPTQNKQRETRVETQKRTESRDKKQNDSNTRSDRRTR